jgi:hypothetical protein
MKILSLSICLFCCLNNLYAQIIPVDTLSTPSSSIRALYSNNQGVIAYGGSENQYGFSEDFGKTFTNKKVTIGSHKIHFRGIEYQDSTLYLLGIDNPGFLISVKNNQEEILHFQNKKGSFWDAIKILPSGELLFVGDAHTNDLADIHISNPTKTDIKNISNSSFILHPGEAFYAASNSNIAVQENHIWIATGGKKTRMMYSNNKGKTFTEQEIPFTEGGQMTGIYTIDFYNSKIGIALGGDWNKQTSKTQNRAITFDGGKNWKDLSKTSFLPYQSDVEFRPGTQGKEIYSCGIPGVYRSTDFGKNWTKISDHSFYTLSFLNANTLILAGKNIIGKINLSDQ